jgi:hypothetical protein
MGKAYCGTYLFQTNVATATTGGGTPLNCEGLSMVCFQPIGIKTGTVQFEATLNQDATTPATTTWIAVRATNANSGTAGTTATADGLYTLDVRGFVACRARVTTLSQVNDGRLDVVGFYQAETT